MSVISITHPINNQEKLFAACSQGNVKQVRKFLGKNVDVNAADTLGNTALHYAAQFNPSKAETYEQAQQGWAAQKNVYQLLLDRGAKMTAKNQANETPVEVATRSSLANAYFLNEQNHPKNTAMRNSIKIMQAIEEHCAQLHLKKLQKAFGSDGIKMDGRLLSARRLKDYGQQIAPHFVDPLFRIAQVLTQKDIIDKSRIIEQFATQGCNFAARDEFDNTPLLWAIANANNTVAMKILNVAQDKNIDLDLDRLNSKFGNNALHLAIAKGHKKKDTQGDKLVYSNRQLTEKLIEAHADVNKKDRDGFTPLDIAIIRRDVKTAKLLLKNGAAIACTPKKLPSYKQAAAFLEAKAQYYTLDKRKFEENTNSILKLLKKKKIEPQMSTSDFKKLVKTMEVAEGCC